MQALTREQIIKILTEIFDNTKRIHPNSDWVNIAIYKSATKLIKELVSDPNKPEVKTAEANFIQTRELTDEEWMKMPKKEILQLYKNCYVMLKNYIGLSGEKIQDVKTYTSTGFSSEVKTAGKLRKEFENLTGKGTEVPGFVDEPITFTQSYVHWLERKVLNDSQFTQLDFPEINFRKDIAEELSRDELINRICEMNENYQKMREEYFEKFPSVPNSKSSEGKEVRTEGEIMKKYGIWEYFNEQHNLQLLESEVDEVVRLALKDNYIKKEIKTAGEIKHKINQIICRYHQDNDYKTDKATEDLFELINVSQFQEQSIIVTDEDEKAITEFDLTDLFDDLEKNAYNAEYHNYNYKQANQIIRKHFEALSLKAQKAQPENKGKETIEKDKETFIKYNLELCNKAFKNGGAHKNWKSFNGRILIKLAREELHYKDTTYAGDIFAHLYDIYSLLRKKGN